MIRESSGSEPIANHFVGANKMVSLAHRVEHKFDHFVGINKMIEQESKTKK